MSRILGILGILVSVCAAAASLFGYLAPEYAVWPVAIGAGLAAFTERIQGGASVVGTVPVEEEPKPSRGIAAAALLTNIVSVSAGTLGHKPGAAIVTSLVAGLINSVTERVQGDVAK